MSRFVCWDAGGDDDPGENPGEGYIVEAYDAEDAAADYAERCWDGADPYDSTTIHVRDESGKMHVVEVTVDYSPQFHGRTKP